MEWFRFGSFAYQWLTLSFEPWNPTEALLSLLFWGQKYLINWSPALLFNIPTIFLCTYNISYSPKTNPFHITERYKLIWRNFKNKVHSCVIFLFLAKKCSLLRPPADQSAEPAEHASATIKHQKWNKELGNDVQVCPIAEHPTTKRSTPIKLRRETTLPSLLQPCSCRCL